MALHIPESIHAQGRIKDGDKWFDFPYAAGTRSHYLRYANGLLICEKDEGNGAGRSIASQEYLANYADIAFVQQCYTLFASKAALTSKGINDSGPINQSATGKDIPYEIVDASGKVAEKALPADAAEEVKKVTQTVQNLANNLTNSGGGGGSTAGGGGTTSGPGTSTTRNIVGWVVIGALVIAGVIGVVALVKYMGKKKR